MNRKELKKNIALVVIPMLIVLAIGIIIIFAVQPSYGAP